MSFHTGQSFTFGETPSATKWNYLWENDYALADGTGIEDDAILTRHISDAQITPSLLDLDPAQQEITTDQATTSTSYTDLATVGPAATVTVGNNGLLLVIWGAGLYTSAAQKQMSIALSGANTVAASDNYAIRRDGASFDQTTSRAKLFTGLTPGSTTVTAKYKTASGTANFFSRFLLAIPL